MKQGSRVYRTVARQVRAVQVLLFGKLLGRGTPSLLQETIHAWTLGVRNVEGSTRLKPWPLWPAPRYLEFVDLTGVVCSLLSLLAAGLYTTLKLSTKYTCVILYILKLSIPAASYTRSYLNKICKIVHGPYGICSRVLVRLKI
jgi:hypothetical protein